jgi:hypothetical protein
MPWTTWHAPKYSLDPLLDYSTSLVAAFAGGGFAGTPSNKLLFDSFHRLLSFPISSTTASSWI